MKCKITGEWFVYCFVDNYGWQLVSGGLSYNGAKLAAVDLASACPGVIVKVE